MKKFILGFILGALLNGMYVNYRITGGIWNRITIREERIKSETAGYKNGFDSGYFYGDKEGFRRCYDNRKDFPFYTPEQSKNF